MDNLMISTYSYTTSVLFYDYKYKNNLKNTGEEVKEQKDPHAGMIYNPISDTWSWL